MTSWRRRLRGTIGMGLTFAAGVGVLASVVGVGMVIVLGGGALPGVLRLVVASAVWAFPIGMAFSGLLALSARGRSFRDLSLPRFATLGAGGGLLLYGVLALNAWSAWTPLTALANLAIFLVLGTGAATATLLVARKSAPALGSGRDADRLPE